MKSNKYSDINFYNTALSSNIYIGGKPVTKESLTRPSDSVESTEKVMDAAMTKLIMDTDKSSTGKTVASYTTTQGKLWWNFSTYLSKSDAKKVDLYIEKLIKSEKE